MKIKESFGERIFGIGNNIFMLFMVFITLYPFWYVIMASLSNNTQLLVHKGLLLLPLGFNLNAYSVMLKNPMIYIGYQNTLFILVVGTFLNIVMTSLGAFVLSRKNLMLRKYLTFIAVFTMYFSGGLIPFYFTVKGLGLADSLWALIIPGALSTYNMIILRTAFASIPDSLEESAKIDGARPITILWKIILPLSLPTIAVLILYYAVAHWNSWFNAMVFLRTRDKFPLQLILREILIDGTNPEISNEAQGSVAVTETLKYSVIIITTVPILLVYPFLQKYFVKGVMVGAVKG